MLRVDFKEVAPGRVCVVLWSLNIIHGRRRNVELEMEGRSRNLSKDIIVKIGRFDE